LKTDFFAKRKTMENAATMLKNQTKAAKEEPCGYPSGYPPPLQMVDGPEFHLRTAQYGKEGIKMLYVAKEGARHSVKELECNTEIFLKSSKEFRYGDNSDVVSSTATIQGAHVIARQHGIQSIESFGLQLTRFFIDRYPGIERMGAYITEKPWARVQDSQGMQHEHAFIMDPSSKRYAAVEVDCKGDTHIKAGIRELTLLKTAKAGFVHFIRDELRLTPDMAERPLSIGVTADWIYNDISAIDFNEMYRKVYKIIVEAFAGPVLTGVHSYSTQYTTHQIQRAILQEIPQIQTVSMTVQNRNYSAVDFSKFPTLANGEGAGQVLVAVSNPQSQIKSTLDRRNLCI